jgi:chloramphenicol-sensitive protein RarD
MKDNNDKRQYEIGMASAVLCAFLWGVLPVYWKALHPIDPFLIMLYRLILACTLVFIGAMMVYKWEGIISYAKEKGALLSFITAGAIISANWGLYIYMVNSGRIVQTSIGYYIEPLVICVFGIMFFKEKLTKFKVIAVLLAFVGVLVMLFSFGQVPLLSMVLAGSFATYAVIKKKIKAPALISLFYETVFILPFALIIILYMELNGKGAFAIASPKQVMLLLMSGVVTALPLSLFAIAANRISLFALGLTEYISPSLGLLLGVFIYNEPFDIYQFAGFVVIWIGLVVFTAGDIIGRREGR